MRVFEVLHDKSVLVMSHSTNRWRRLWFSRKIVETSDEAIFRWDETVLENDDVPLKPIGRTKRSSAGEVSA